MDAIDLFPDSKAVPAMKAGASISSEYLFVRVHALWTRELQGESLRKLIESEARADLFRWLEEHGIAPDDRTLVQKRLIELMLGDLGRLLVLCEPPMAAWFQVQMLRFFFDNLKTLLHYRYFPETDVDIHWLLVESPHLPAVDPGLLLDAPSARRFVQLLPPFPGKNEFEPIVAHLEEKRDIFQAEAGVDRLYLHLLLSTAETLGDDSGGGAAAILAKTECDVANALTVLRNAAIYHLPPERIEPIVHPGGRLRPSAWAALAAQNSVEAIRSGLPEHFRRILDGLPPDRLHLWENALWGILQQHTWHAFRDFDTMENSLAAYPYLKWFQTLDINRVYEGFYFHLKPEEILEMMIGL